jgi:hypothetical protein
MISLLFITLLLPPKVLDDRVVQAAYGPWSQKGAGRLAYAVCD